MKERDYTIGLLESAAQEIRHLRRRNELLGAQVSTFERVYSIFETVPKPQYQGMEEDLAHKLEKRARELDGPGPQKPREDGLAWHEPK